MNSISKSIMDSIGYIIGTLVAVAIVTFFAAVTGIPAAIYFFALGAGLVLGIGLFIINVYHNLLDAKQVEGFHYGECV